MRGDVPKLVSAFSGQEKRASENLSGCRPVLYLSCSAECLNSIPINSSFCCSLVPSEPPALIWSNSAPLGNYLWFVLMALPQKDSLQVNSQFNVLFQAMPSGSAIRTRPSTQHTVAVLTQPKPASQQRATAGCHTRHRKTTVTFPFQKDGAQMWQKSEGINLLCPKLEM